MPRDSRRPGPTFVLLVALGACSSSSASPPGDAPVDGATSFGAAVREVSAESVAVGGDGRALAAGTRPDDALVVVTTTGIVVADGGDVRSVATFDARPLLPAVAPLGDRIAWWAETGTVRVADTATGEVTATWSAPVGVDARRLWFEPAAGRLVVETSAGPVIIERDGTVGADVADGVTAPGKLASLPDGSIVGAVDAARIGVFGGDGPDAHDVPLGDGEQLMDVEVSPAGALIGVSAASTGDGFERRDRVILLDRAFSVVGVVETDTLLAPGSWTLTDDGVVVATEQELVSWSTDGAEVGRAGLAAPIAGLGAIDGDVVVVGRDGALLRWDGSSAVVPLADAEVTTVYRSIDAATGTITTVDRFGAVAVRDAGDGHVVAASDALAIGELTSLAVTADDATLAVTSTTGSLRLLDGSGLDVRDEVQAAPRGVLVGDVAVDPSGGGLATGRAERLRSEAFDDTVTTWSWSLAERPSVLGEVADVPGCGAFGAHLAFDPTGGTLFAASHDFGVAVVEASSMALVDELPGSATILDLAVSADGSTLVVTHDDGVVDVWDLADRALVSTYRPGQAALVAVAILPEGEVMVAADVAGSLSLLDVATGATLLAFEGQAERTGPIAVSPDGAVVAAPLSGGGIGFWSTDDGTQVGTAAGHLGQVTALAFGAADATLFSASEDGTVRRWALSVVV